METLELKKIKENWLKQKIKYAIVEFNAGGDQISEFEVSYYDINEEKFDSDIDIENFVLDHVDIYDDSNGHYLGENGEILVEYDNKNFHFSFTKKTTSEYNETEDDEIEITLEKNVTDLLTSEIAAIVYSTQSDNTSIIRCKDGIISEDDDELINSTINRVIEYISNKTRDTYYSSDIEISSSKKILNRNFDDIQNEGLIIEDNKLKMFYSVSYISSDEEETFYISDRI